MPLMPPAGTRCPCPNCNSPTNYTIEGMTFWGDVRDKEVIHCVVCDDCGAISTIKRTEEEAIRDWNASWLGSSFNTPTYKKPKAL